ncbi:MAG: HNH endonuclease [Verrucomicrobiaceae bacterium]|nr:HNH endonuclease [Verrucomicrobiaceae bacterium]
MSLSRIPAELRLRVRERATGRCEYCLLHERHSDFSFHVDHVIAEKHGGPTEEHNLCLACPECNRAKGSDISTMINGRYARLFNPRIEDWADHFVLNGAVIMARSRIAAGTIRLLDLNNATRVATRASLLLEGRYP